MAPVKLMTLVRCEDLPAWRRALTARITAGVPGLTRLLLNIVTPVQLRPDSGSTSDSGPAPARWDAVLEAWFDTRAALDAFAAVATEGASLVNLIVEQKLIHDSCIRPLAAKVIVAFRRRAGQTRAAAQAHWAGRHVEVGLVENHATDFLRLYFQNHVIESNQVARPEHDYDGLPEYWLDEDALGNVGPDSAVMRAIAADEKHFITPGSVVTMLVQEYLIFARDTATHGWAVALPDEQAAAAQHDVQPGRPVRSFQTNER